MEPPYLLARAGRECGDSKFKRFLKTLSRVTFAHTGVELLPFSMGKNRVYRCGRCFLKLKRPDLSEELAFARPGGRLGASAKYRHVSTRDALAASYSCTAPRIGRAEFLLVVGNGHTIVVANGSLYNQF